MAVHYTIICDDCGVAIATDPRSARAARAHAQLNRRASCSGGVDRCDACRRAHVASTAGGDALRGAHSIGPGHPTS